MRKDFAKCQQNQQKANHRHDDDIVTDACSNLQPASIVSHQEEEMLKRNAKDACQGTEILTLRVQESVILHLPSFVIKQRHIFLCVFKDLAFCDA